MREGCEPERMFALKPVPIFCEQDCSKINIMLSDLEYAYSPVRARVHDLREYL